MSASPRVDRSLPFNQVAQAQLGGRAAQLRRELRAIEAAMAELARADTIEVAEIDAIARRMELVADELRETSGALRAIATALLPTPPAEERPQHCGLDAMCVLPNGHQGGCITSEDSATCARPGCSRGRWFGKLCKAHGEVQR